jgi:hypothetical protein
MKRLLERMDDFVSFCLDWGNEELAKARAATGGTSSNSPLFILLVIVFGALAFVAAV